MSEFLTLAIFIILSFTSYHPDYFASCGSNANWDFKVDF